MPGHSASEGARERAYDPGIHLLRKKFLQKAMDCRVKPGNDDLESGLFAVRAHDGQ
jgi:hypothetical protein